MNNYKCKKYGNQRGISLLALIITILVMGVITSVLVYDAKDSISIRNYKNLENDLEILTNKVETYYLQNGVLPILKYGEPPTSVVYSGYSNYLSQKQANDNNTYYVIDLKQLSGLTLNYGKEFYDVTDIVSTQNVKDVYVINEQSHHIYYVDGVLVKGKLYYTIEKDSKVTLYNN